MPRINARLEWLEAGRRIGLPACGHDCGLRAQGQTPTEEQLARLRERFDRTLSEPSPPRGEELALATAEVELLDRSAAEQGRCEQCSMLAMLRRLADLRVRFAEAHLLEADRGSIAT
jgi:hypothetical protein